MGYRKWKKFAISVMPRLVFQCITVSRLQKTQEILNFCNFPTRIPAPRLQKVEEIFNFCNWQLQKMLKVRDYEPTGLPFSHIFISFLGFALVRIRLFRDGLIRLEGAEKSIKF